MANKHLRFWFISFLRWSIASDSLLLVIFMITFLVVLVAFLPSGGLWQPLMSKGFTSISESLQIPITICSRFWFTTSFEIPEIPTLLRLLYCSELDCCFSRVIVLFWRFLLTFLTINNSLLNFSLAVTRRSHSLKVWRFGFIILGYHYQPLLSPSNL